jgi:hypothetical protein
MVLEPEFRTAEMQGRAFPWGAVASLHSRGSRSPRRGYALRGKGILGEPMIGVGSPHRSSPQFDGSVAGQSYPPVTSHTVLRQSLLLRSAFAAPALAQTDAAVPRRSETDNARVLWQQVRSNLARAADDAPATMYDYKPTPDVRSLGRHSTTWRHRRTATVAYVLLENALHDGEHYGNIVTYLRLNHIVPPSSQPTRP